MNRNHPRFRVSDKVVCVDNLFRHPVDLKFFTAWPIRGQTYVVRGVVHAAPSGRETLWLVGIKGVRNPAGMETGFRAERFRPLSEVQAEAGARMMA